MKNQDQTRILAYNVAKEISEEELKEVSGGRNTCMGTCLQPSGNGGPVTWDLNADIKVDW